MGDPRATRLRQALELFEVAEALVLQRLIREGVPAEVRKTRLREWRLARPHARHGDCPGPTVDLERFR